MKRCTSSSSSFNAASETSRVAVLKRQAGGIGARLSESDARGLVGFTTEILSENRAVNLTGIDAFDDALRLHVVDSLAALPELSRAPAGQAIDIGSGGGFPGVPLAIVGRRSFVLLDSIGKKTAAVQRALAASGVPGNLAVATTGRAETFALEHPEEFAAVVARAVAPLASLVELASPLLRQGGILIALKGRLKDTERESGALAAAIVGLTEMSRRCLQLPEGGEDRTLVAYVKDHVPRIPLPRRVGLAQRRPLAQVATECLYSSDAADSGEQEAPS